jgi:hypothetical protein
MVEKDRWQGEKEGGPDNDTKSARPFGKVKQRGEKERERDYVDDDRNDDGRRRADEVIDEIVIGGDEGTGEVEQIQVRQAEGDRSRVS